MSRLRLEESLRSNLSVLRVPAKFKEHFNAAIAAIRLGQLVEVDLDAGDRKDESRIVVRGWTEAGEVADYILMVAGAEIVATYSCTCSAAQGACTHLVATVIGAHLNIAAQAGLPSLDKTLPIPSLRHTVGAEEWLNAVSELEAESVQDSGPSKSVGDRCIAIRVGPTGTPNCSSIVGAEVALIRQKRHGLREITPVRAIDGRLNKQPLDGWTPQEDRAIRGLVARNELKGYGRASYAPREGKLNLAEEECLLDLLGTHALYLNSFEHPNEAVQLAGNKRMSANWEVQRDGTYKVKYGVPGGFTSVNFIAGAAKHYYLCANDEGTWAFGELTGPTWMLGQQAPTNISRRMVRKVQRKLDSMGIDHGGGLETFVPPPLIREKAQPILKLGERSHAGGRSGYFKLQFRYGEHRARPGTDNIDLPDAEIVRDVESERQAIQILETMGFRESVPPKAAHAELLSSRGTKSAQEIFAACASTLSDIGIEVEVDSSEVKLKIVEVFEIQAEMREVEGKRWLDVSLGIDIEGVVLDITKVIVAALADRGVKDIDSLHGRRLYIPLEDGRILTIPGDSVREIIRPFFDMLKLMTEGEGLRVSRLSAAGMIQASSPATQWKVPEAIRNSLPQLLDRTNRRSLPVGLSATPRQYQVDGIDWLNWLSDAHLGGILADDLGLGKTFMVLAHVASEKEVGRLSGPTLVSIPKALISNWVNEIRDKVPSLTYAVHEGPNRGRFIPERLQNIDILLTTYPVILRDYQDLAKVQWQLHVYDEAHSVFKNESSKTRRAIVEIPSGRRLAITGTPLENHLGEFWSIFDMVEPGLLGTRTRFRELFQNPIEKDGDNSRMAILKRRVRPLLLRRLKSQVQDELPPLQESIIEVELEGSQRALYENLRAVVHRQVTGMLKERGQKARLQILETLTLLRQACLSPALLIGKVDGADKVVESAKEDGLWTMIPTLVSEGRVIMIYCAFVSMLKLIGRRLEEEGIAYLQYTGEIVDARARDEIVDRFMGGETQVLLMSRAGGLGLNLQRVDTVMIYDPWWQGQVEKQIISRAHRQGQKNTVFLFRFLVRGSIEERITALKERKSKLFDALLSSDEETNLEAGVSGLTEADIEFLLEPLG